jgi:2-(1,2-epoxy-1,2-dihydrophenyl)acetyl-CoA isomerase
MEPMMDPLFVDRTDGVVTLTMHRPDAMNALDVPLKEALRDTLAALATDPAARAVVLTGAGSRAFCVGQDLREHVGFLASGDEMPLRTVSEHYNPIAQALATLPMPVIAAVRGAAAGAGASLALLSDLRVGGPSTSFLMAFARVGLAGDTGISWILPRLVGHAKAVELLMLAEPVRAGVALELGLLSRLVDDDDAILPAAQELAARLAAGPTRAYAAIKRELTDGAAGSLAHALAVEAEAQAECGATADHREGTYAFVEKRPPAYIGA